MKNILLTLLLANILYFVWGKLQSAPDEPGVEIVSESDLGPPLSVAQAPKPELIESVGAVLGSGEASDLLAVVGRSCVTIGPLQSRADADRAATRYAGEGMRVSQRSSTGQWPTGDFWVQIRDIPSREESRRILGVLKSGGLPEAYTLDTDDDGLKIMLGLFGKIEGAEKTELQASSLGFAADISPRLNDTEVFYVDIALPPGEGASEIVELHGEDIVAIHNAAICPQTN